MSTLIQATAMPNPILPLLKWPGGKRGIAPLILPHLTGESGTYFEPFLGGAAMFCALKPVRAVLADINGELIDCYRVIKDSPEALARRLHLMKNSEEHYYKVRASRPVAALERAARFIYLTSLSFNGIYRQNLCGEFNVPYGKKVSKKLPSVQDISALSSALSVAELRNCDFEASTHCAKRGDVVYFDPPYTVAHNNNGFVKYNAAIFSWEDQRRLAEHAKKLVERGCRVVVSNADHPSVRALYPGFNHRIIKRSSVMAASSAFRKPVTESLFTAEHPSKDSH